jgi:radical SAM protein with 4Fe4S-binding SPASM domain
MSKLTLPILKDGINFLFKMSPRRGWNTFLIFSSFYYARMTRKSVIWGRPIAISVEPTTSCNLRCPECPSGLRSFNRETGMLNLDVFGNIINQLYKTTPYLILYFQGEPYLNKNFFDFVKIASNRNMYVATSTNAHYMTKENAEKTIESGLDRLIISIDGTTQSVYENYRIGGKLDKVIEGTKNIIEAKKRLKSNTPHIIFQFLVVKPNEHQIEEVQKLGDSLGVDEVRFKTAQVYDYENGNPLIPENQKYSRYIKNKDGKYSLKNKMYNHCWRLWHTCVFTWDGVVVPCAFDKDAKYQFGNIENDAFAKIWQSVPYHAFRQNLLKSRTQIDICTNCTEGTKVWG